MAAKGSRKGSQKENGKIKPQNNNFVLDELDLRDEILDLKREIALLRKERDRLLIRLRKSEEDARKKDKQIEQLMDPAQNSEIRRLLSTKGAALLLNIKEQNKTLIQMLINKDLQIKRLLGEVKTAKLYSRSSKTEPYKAEISRLRIMLLQSQEHESYCFRTDDSAAVVGVLWANHEGDAKALKEAAPTPQVTICSQHSSSSSDRTSPRELDELRFTIQSLETHMKYSKELLGKKNKEIMLLNQQLTNCSGNRQCKGLHDLDWKDSAELLKFDSARRCVSTSLLSDFQSPKIEKPEIIKNTPRQRSMPLLPSKISNIPEDEISKVSEKEQLQSDMEEAVRSRKLKGSLKSKLNGSGNVEIERSSSGREKWKNVLKKLRNSSKQKRIKKKTTRKVSKESLTNASSDHEKYILPMKNKDGRVVHSNWRANDDDIWSVLQGELMMKDEMTDIPVAKPRKLSLPASFESAKAEVHFEQEIKPTIEPKTTETENLVKEYEKEEEEEVKITEESFSSKTFQSFYRRSVDSSIDSECGSRQEPKSFEVEVEINTCPSLSSLSDSPVRTNGVGKDGVGGDNYCDFEFDDDDDVVTVV